MHTSEEEIPDTKVREIMSRPIITEDEDVLVTEVVKDMAELSIGSVVITSGGKHEGCRWWMMISS
ncbi:MAG: hypothetical protein IBX41_06170 [Methanophagales archaeon]|nr:hypothetical protein [Methanophagales archaeon]